MCAILMGAGGCATLERLVLVVCVYLLVNSPGWTFRGAGEVGIPFAVVALANAVLDAASSHLSADDGAFVLRGFVFSPAVLAYRGVHAHSPDVMWAQAPFAVRLVEVRGPFSAVSLNAGEVNSDSNEKKCTGEDSNL